jgi:hydrogenase maturation protease
MTGVSIGIKPTGMKPRGIEPRGSESSIRVLGLGNDILGDDALGILVARQAEARFGGQVEVVSSSQAGFHVMDQLLGVSRLVVVDCIQTGAAKPGTVYVLDEHAVRPAPGVSSHSLGIFEVLAVARSLGLPAPAQCVILAVEAADCTTVGGSMHPDVEAAIPAVMEWIGRFLAGEPGGAV